MEDNVSRQPLAHELCRFTLKFQIIFHTGENNTRLPAPVLKQPRSGLEVNAESS